MTTRETTMLGGEKRSPFARRWALSLAAMLASLSLMACGSSALDHTISASKLKDMSRQGQLWVYDAENGIVVALDRLDEARDEYYRVRDQLVRADKLISAAERRRKGVRVAEAWRDALRSLRKWAIANVRLHRLGVLVANAAVELAKAQVIQREDLLGGKDTSVKDFQEQFRKLSDEFDARKKAVRAQRRLARRAEKSWRKIRLRYVARTGDHDSGLWVD